VGLLQSGMAASFNWQRQFVILILAACFAIYWTGKQGLWDALRGTSPIDKHWADAKQALIRRLPPKYEVVDGTNQRLEKRLLVLALPAPPSNKAVAEGSDQAAQVPAPTIAAELIPITREKRRRERGARERGRDRDRDRDRFDRDKKSQGKSPFGGRNKDRRDRRGRREPDRESVARLRIHDPALNYLKDMFGSTAPMSQDQLIQTKEEEEADAQAGGEGGQRDTAQGRAGGHAHHYDSEF